MGMKFKDPDPQLSTTHEIPTHQKTRWKKHSDSVNHPKKEILIITSNFLTLDLLAKKLKTIRTIRRQEIALVSPEVELISKKFIIYYLQ